MPLFQLGANCNAFAHHIARPSNQAVKSALKLSHDVSTMLQAAKLAWKSERTIICAGKTDDHDDRLEVQRTVDMRKSR